MNSREKKIKDVWWGEYKKAKTQEEKELCLFFMYASWENIHNKKTTANENTQAKMGTSQQ